MSHTVAILGGATWWPADEPTLTCKGYEAELTLTCKGYERVTSRVEQNGTQICRNRCFKLFHPTTDSRKLQI